MQPSPSSQPAGHMAAVSHDELPPQVTSQAQAVLHRVPAAQALLPEQATLQRSRPHWTSAAHESAPSHSTTQSVAPPQSTPSAHERSPWHSTRQSTPVGQVTASAHESSSVQSMTQVCPWQLPTPAQAVAQSTGVSPASGCSGTASGDGAPSVAPGAASIAPGLESWPGVPPGLELSKPQAAPATMAQPTRTSQPIRAIQVTIPGSPKPAAAGRRGRSHAPLQVTRPAKRRKLRVPPGVEDRSRLLQRKHRRRLWGALAVLVVAGGALLAYRLIWKRGGGPVEYQTEVAERGSLSSQVTASGTLSPLVTVQVGSQVSGRILELKADFNSRVEKGQVIARIDPQLFATEVAKARANFGSARAQVARAEAELAQANRNHDRTSSLAEQQLVARADVESALAAQQTAQASLAAARAQLSQAKAAVEQAATNLELTTIVSPISGIVISRNVDVGQTVAASLQAPTLFTIAEDLAKMEVHTSVAESDVGRLTAAMPVEFTVDAYPTDRFKATVKEVRFSPQTVQNVVTYDAVVAVDNSDLKLRPGMTADVTFLVDKREGVVMVPNAALRFRPPEKVLDAIGWQPPADRGRPGGAGRVRGAERAARRLVWKLDRAGVPAPAMIEIGISDGKMTEVVKGLGEGERVIVGVKGAEPAGGEPGGGGPGGSGNDRNRRRFGRFL